MFEQDPDLLEILGDFEPRPLNKYEDIINKNNGKLETKITDKEDFYEKIQSYKDLHFTLFQISNKFRDEKSTQYGLIRKKEFCMADAYSFDADDGGLDISYDKMYQCFKNIFLYHIYLPF